VVVVVATGGGPGPALLDPGPAGLGGVAADATAADGGLGAGPALGQLVGVHAAHDDRDVARALADAGGPAPGPGAPALEGRALVGEAGRHVELVGVDLVVVLGVGHGGGEHLADLGGDGPVGELEHAVGVLDVEPADEVEDLAGLVGRHAEVPDLGAGAGPLVRLRPEGHQASPSVVRPFTVDLVLASPGPRGT
jgi:hypothetical protein